MEATTRGMESPVPSKVQALGLTSYSNIQCEDQDEYYCGDSHTIDGQYGYDTVTQTKGK